MRSDLTEFGRYIAECLPKFIQKSQVTVCDELELLVSPIGIVPVLSFLKDHHNAQFENLTDICGMDVPSRECRFEVCSSAYAFLHEISYFANFPINLPEMLYYFARASINDDSNLKIFWLLESFDDNWEVTFRSMGSK